MTRRAYFYHLKIELYPPNSSRNHQQLQQPPRSKRPDELEDRELKEVYIPPKGGNIFDIELPAHSRTSADESFRKLRHKTAVPISRFEHITAQDKVIDCGSVTDSELRNNSFPQPNIPFTLESAVRDWRFGPVVLESVDMAALRTGADIVVTKSGPSGNIHAGPRSQVTKARFEPLVDDIKHTYLGWGIVHLYRDAEETHGIDSRSDEMAARRHFKEGDASGMMKASENGSENEDTTILCIPAVPSYMTPRDFLGWVGEKTREEVSHFRMIMTSKMNRYLVLMKFRDGDVAKKWRDAWDGRVFNGMEPENCHVMFIKSITFQTPQSSSTPQDSATFPDMSHDPFTPNLHQMAAGPSTASLALKPFPPPTPSLVELPTCPVCLERMDDTTGLLTIQCQHVFHCACLQKWRGSGCPVCRHTQPNASLDRPFGASASDLCQVCDCADDLWICLICGHVGCGRYKGGHAKEHWKETAHNYALEIETQYVWDYAGDIWVHRLIQTKGDGKLVELPSDSRNTNLTAAGLPGDSNEGESLEMVPSAKLENIGMEYTHLLTSQLESQRLYYEDIVKKAVDKASAATRTAEAAIAKAEEASVKLKELSIEHTRFRDEIVPSLERDRDRLATKAEKSSELARAMTRSFQEEKQVGKGLMERIGHLNEGMAKMSKELGALKEENADLKEQNRDLSMFISGQEKLKELEGQLGEEVTQGTISLPEHKVPKGKGKGRGNGRAQ